ncbi:MAG: glutamate--tRNA ligase family protein, partial [Burkholderiaceae bacterium]
MSAQHNKPKTEVLSPNDKPEASNFLRHIIEDDLAAGRVASVVTRFPPEPTGYLHFGQAKSNCL